MKVPTPILLPETLLLVRSSACSVLSVQTLRDQEKDLLVNNTQEFLKSSDSIYGLVGRT